MPDWIDKKISVGNIITIACGVFALVGFYFTTSLTLNYHEKQIERLFAENKQFFVKLSDVQTSERQEREKVRSEFVERSERGADNQIKTIERLVAVETEIRGLRSDLSRVLQRLDNARPN